MSDSPFITDFRALLTKHGIKHPAFAHGAKDFDPARPRVLYSGPVYDTEEIVAGVSALVEGKWSVAGEHTHKFERLFSQYLNQAESVAVNSGSSADLLMVAAAKKRFGWRDGDGVIVSPAAFPTTISAITLNNLTPVFVDIEWETLNADNDQIERRLAIPPKSTHLGGGIIGDFDYKHDGHDLLVRCWHQTDQTQWTRYGPTIRAILISPVLGNPPDMDRLTELATRFDVKLLLDGCDSLGSTWRGKHLAEYVVASTCSFFPSHHISSLDYNEPIMVKSPSGDILFPKIGDFVRGGSYKDWQCPAFDKAGQIEWRPITGLVEHPTRDNDQLLRIMVDNGRNCSLTANHSLFRLDDRGEIECVDAGQLKVGDYVLVPNKLPTIDGTTSVAVQRFKRGSWTQSTEPMVLDEDFAWLLGIYVAEGSLCKTARGNHNIAFNLHQNETVIANRIIRVIRERWGVTFRAYPQKDSLGQVVTGSSKSLYLLLHEHCKHKALHKEVPQFIFTAHADIKVAFLRGCMDGDGSWADHKQHKYMLYATSSRQLSLQIYHLLMMLGVNSRYYVTKGKTVTIHRNKKPSKVQPSYRVGFGSKTIIDALGFRSSTSKGGRRFGNLSLSKVRKIVPVEPTVPFVYDLCVAGYENFVSGVGFIVHNTLQGGMVSSNDTELVRIARQMSQWGRSCYCVGQANLLPNGSCGCRFKSWLPALPDVDVDHKYVYETDRAYNLQMPDMLGAIGCVQMGKLEAIHAKRIEAAGRIRTLIWTTLNKRVKLALAGPDPSAPLAHPSWFGVPFICPDYDYKRALVAHLESAGIQTRNYFAGNILQHPGYAHLGRAADYPNASEVLKRVFFLGCHPLLTEAHFNHIEETMKSFKP